MKKKLIILVVLFYIINFTVSGCSDSPDVSVKGNPLVKQTAASTSGDTSSQKKTLVKVIVKKSDLEKRVFNNPEDIKVFATSIETGIPIKNIPSELKVPPYFMYFSYSNNETVEYFLYISQNSGWVYQNGTGKAYTISKKSVKALNRLLISFEENGHSPKDWLSYNNKDYHISLEYPSDWEAVHGYSERYGGNDAFFQIDAINGKSLSIDKVTELDAFHKLKPYGSNPQIKELKVQGQVARLITPSSDQPKEMQNQAGLIIKYPKPIKIGNGTYYYFILWADKAHIEQISQTINFVY